MHVSLWLWFVVYREKTQHGISTLRTDICGHTCTHIYTLATFGTQQNKHRNTFWIVSKQKHLQWHHIQLQTGRISYSKNSEQNWIEEVSSHECSFEIKTNWLPSIFFIEFEFFVARQAFLIWNLRELTTFNRIISENVEYCRFLFISDENSLIFQIYLTCYLWNCHIVI